jgi:hypothetical protein
MLLPLFATAIDRLDLSGFDLAISSSHAVAKGVRTPAGQLHICYCYSPMRYAWDQRETYLRQVGLQRGIGSWLVRRVLDRIQRWDRASSERVDHFVAISRHIAARIERCNGRPPSIIYPPLTCQLRRGAPSTRAVTTSQFRGSSRAIGSISLSRFSASCQSASSSRLRRARSAGGSRRSPAQTVDFCGGLRIANAKLG